MAAAPLEAAHAKPSSSGVTVNAVNQFGEALPGDFYTVSQPVNYGPYGGRGEAVVATGVTSSTFAAPAGPAYTLQVYTYGSCTFSHWSHGALSDPTTFAATGAALSFTAVYDCAGAVKTASSSIIVSTEYTNGAALSGAYAVLER